MPCKMLWQLPWISAAFALYRRITADGRGNCCGLTSAEIAAAIAADFRGNCRVSEDGRGNGRGWPFDVRGNCRAIAADFRALPCWYHGFLATDRTAARAVATTVAFAVEAP